MAPGEVAMAEAEPLTRHDSATTPSNRSSLDTITTVSTTSLVLENIDNPRYLDGSGIAGKPKQEFQYRDNDDDPEDGIQYVPPAGRPADKRMMRAIWALIAIAILGWGLAFVNFVATGSYKHPSTKPFDQDATASKGAGKKITLDQVLGGQWGARWHSISWIPGPNGEDALLLEKGETGKDYLVVEDVRSRTSDTNAASSRTLMKDGYFEVLGKTVNPSRVWPSPDLKTVLIMSDEEHNFRNSFTGKYWLFDVEQQKAQPLDPMAPEERIQLASWAPTSDAVVFTRGNNMFLRELSSTTVKQITKDGGTELFYGVPDWVYEEEVFHGNSATWWSKDGKYVAYLRTNETLVPEYPVQYFVSRPSGKVPQPGEENYPDTRLIKYPKAGAPNPVVDLEFYDVEKQEVFTVDIAGGYDDDDRLIIEILWASAGRVLVRETNRESDNFRLVLIDVGSRTGKVVRKENIAELDGGWVEPTQSTRYIPADPANGRPHEGYIETIPYNGYDHLAYFTPLDSSEPVMLTSGDWEVDDAPSAIDLKNNLVYFVATKQGPTQRQIYSVKLDGSDFKSSVDTSKPGWYGASFSEGAGYMLLTYRGPGIPWQKIVNTPSSEDSFDLSIETNEQLSKMAAEHEMPITLHQTINIDGIDFPLVERRPPHFDENSKKKYPVLFHLYQGPGSQTVRRTFGVPFESFVAANLGYIVVELDATGTGFLGRKVRSKVRGQLGYWEAHDQIQAAKIWSQKPYVDPHKLAIWGWSYGGFMTLKVLEQDGGETFSYGMAVAPVTDWRFYDSVYTERYMRTPQNNPSGYDGTAISNTSALINNVRFLVMHGSGDDNVHVQNTLTLIDKLDLAGAENYDMAIFPDSDHSIYFHGANHIVYDKLVNWLVNAFNGEWLKTDHPEPMRIDKRDLLRHQEIF